MKYCNKGDEPESFAQWKNKNASQNNWNDLSNPQSQYHPVYTELRRAIIEQQKQMCCYCEVALVNEQDAHVEHLKDQDSYPAEKFNFVNLLASCQKNDCCGHKKGNGFFDNMVSPLSVDCQNRFTYTARGEIIPQDETDNFAQETIDLLGLNCKRLKLRRVSIIKTLEVAEREYLRRSLISSVEWFDGFYTVIEYVMNKRT